MLRRKCKTVSSKDSWGKYRKQRNFVTKLHKQSIIKYTKDKCISTKNGSDFWKTVKPLISDKHRGTNSISLMENETVINDSEQVANILNNYFSNIAENIGNPDHINENETFEEIISLHSSHESVERI